MRIAICDDEKNIRELIGNKVAKQYPEADIVFFQSGEELLLSDKHVDILFLDIQMSGKNGMETARKLRREMTPHERKLWYLFLRKYPVKFYKQRIVGRFIVDFYCASAKMVIELDGSQHFEEQEKTYDRERSTYLESLGLKVVRYSNDDIDRNFSAVCEQIDLMIKERLQ